MNKILNIPILNKINIKKTLIAIILLVLIGGLGWQILMFGKQVASRWEEIKFAFNKPNIVSVIREDYNAKQTKLDQSFLIKDKSAEDKLVEEVLSKLKEQSLK